MARWYALIAVLLLAGCANGELFGRKIFVPGKGGPPDPRTLDMQVKASSLDDTIAGRTFHVFRDEGATLTVEEAQFSEALRRQLAQIGLTEVGSMEAAHYVLLFQYGDKTVLTTRRIPNWGVTGYTSRTRTGSYTGTTTTTTPTFGITGFEHVPDSKTFRVAGVQAFDAQKIVREGLMDERWKVAGAADPAYWRSAEPAYNVMLRGMATVMGKNVPEPQTILVKELPRRGPD
jgi:hypothetical protein